MSSFNETDAGSSFAGKPGQTYWDEGIESSILALQYAAKQTGNGELVQRANDLQARLTAQWFPIVSGLFIKGDALKLDDDIKAITGRSTVYQIDAGIGGVYAVAPPDVEAQVGGDVGANVDALADDVKTTIKQDLPEMALKASKYLVILLVLLAVLLYLDRR